MYTLLTIDIFVCILLCCLLHSRDLGVNSLMSLNKAAFHNLVYLTELDLFDNKIDYFPENIFKDLSNLEFV